MSDPVPERPAGASGELSGRVGKYEIRHQLGKGAMGVVYRAYDTVLERDVALRVMVSHMADDPGVYDRFAREAKAVARMRGRPGGVRIALARSCPWSSRGGAGLAAAAVLAAAAARAEPPQVEHQPAPCSLPGRAISLCATITDDGQVAKARLYFRPAGEKFYSYVDMEFGGLSFCGTLPAPREGKLKSIDYYVQAVDDQLESHLTNRKQGKKLPDGFSAAGVTVVAE